MEEVNLLLKMSLAGGSSMLAACVTNPIDVVKVRMQLEGELKSQKVMLSQGRSYSNFFSGLVFIFQNEGMKGLYKGLSASLAREATYSSIRLGAYDPMKKLLGANDAATTPLYTKILAAAITGVIRHIKFVYLLFEYSNV